MKKVLMIVLSIVAVLIAAFFATGALAEAEFQGEISTTVPADTYTVWNYLSDIESLATRRAEIVSVEMQGTNDRGLPRWREIPDMGGYADFEALEMIPGRKLTVRMNGSSFGMTGTWSYSLEPTAENGTRILVTEDSRIDSIATRAIMTLAGRDSNLQVEAQLLNTEFAGERAE